MKTYVLSIADSNGKAPVCKKCNKGEQYLDVGGDTGYLIRCDSCRHSFSVVLNNKK